VTDAGNGIHIKGEKTGFETERKRQLYGEEGWVIAWRKSFAQKGLGSTDWKEALRIGREAGCHTGKKERQRERRHVVLGKTVQRGEDSCLKRQGRHGMNKGCRQNDKALITVARALQSTPDRCRKIQRGTTRRSAVGLLKFGQESGGVRVSYKYS